MKDQVHSSNCSHYFLRQFFLVFPLKMKAMSKSSLSKSMEKRLRWEQSCLPWGPTPHAGGAAAPWERPQSRSPEQRESVGSWQERGKPACKVKDLRFLWPIFILLEHSRNKNKGSRFSDHEISIQLNYFKVCSSESLWPVISFREGIPCRLDRSMMLKSSTREELLNPKN